MSSRIDYLPPLERAIGHTRAILFRPFDPAKWLVIGFGCWLAELLDGSGSSGTGWRLGGGSDDAEAAQGLAAAAGEIEWLPAFLVGVAVWLVVTLLAVALVVFVVFLWLSARGRFIFLDNVARNHGAIREPWSAYRREGNSLFLWSLGLTLAALAAFAVVLAPAALTAYLGDGPVPLLGIALTLALGGATTLAVIYTQLFLVDFVVPIMFRERCTASAAWWHFLPLLRRHPLAFLLYGVVVFVLWVVVISVVVVAGLFTCCVAWLLLLLPYLGTVFLLPVYTTFRAFSLEFLGQLRPEWNPLGGPGAPAVDDGAAAG